MNLNIIFQFFGFVLIVTGYLLGKYSEAVARFWVEFYPITEAYYENTRNNSELLFYRDPIFSWYYEWTQWIGYLGQILGILGLMFVLCVLIRLLSEKRKTA